jgi:hypothetical protein
VPAAKLDIMTSTISFVSYKRSPIAIPMGVARANERSKRYPLLKSWLSKFLEIDIPRDILAAVL